MEPIPPSKPEQQIAIWLQQAISHQRQGRAGDAASFYQQILTADPRNFEALQGLAILHAQAGRGEEALNHMVAACDVQPCNAPAQFNRGKILYSLRHLDQALSAYDQAIALKPDFAEAFNNRGNVLKDLQRYSEALACYNRAISLRSHYVNALNNRGAILTLLHRYEEALADYERILSLNPNLVGALNNRAIILGQLRRYPEALADYDKLMALSPDYPYAVGDRLHIQMRLNDWDDYQERVTTVMKGLERNLPSSRPFPLLALPTSPALLHKSAALYMADQYPPAAQTLWQGERYDHERIRIGYFSADFHNHATAYLMAELFELHKREHFEIYGFSFGPPHQDEMRSRLEKGFDHFFELSDQGDQAIAALAYRHEIDIAVDLKGYTLDCRPGIFALRPAPIQVNYLGFPGTLAAPYMDYILADPIVLPEAHFPHYNEKVVHLPHSYQVNDTKRLIASTSPTRSELGLPENGFVFCCFNNNFKITPDVFDLWMALMMKVERSVLWLFEDHPDIPDNLRREASRRGIGAERLIFAPRIPLAEHLARLNCGDLFLDTFYYNAHTTASDALWAGLPVITCLGDTFAGRVAASLLTAVGLPELITRNHQEYAALALRLATHPEELAAIKRKLAAQRLTTPLFDTEGFTQDIEAAYIAMWQRHQQGLPPDHIRIPSHT